MTSVLIIAQSARALAQSAAKAGWKVHALDQFADLDTISASQRCTAVGGFDDAARVLAAVDQLLNENQPDICIVGGGLESSLGLLKTLNQRLPLTGNSLEIYRRLCDPISFCTLLDNLDIAYPETMLEGPAPATGWLAKRVGGSGGGHVRPLAVGELPGIGCYRQRRVDGLSASVLFLANGRNAQVLGYTRHWQAQPDSGRPYRRSGLIRWPAVPASAQVQLENALNKLARATGLRGLCGLDFVLTGDGRVVVLEINPRPPASFELHEGEASLLEAHRQACDGELASPPLAPQSTVRASVVLYTEELFKVPAGFSWLEWCADIPAAGTMVGQDRPVCSVTATAAGMETAQALVRQRLLMLQSELRKFKSIT